MEILKSTIKIGLKVPIKFLHITDTHLPAYIPNDSENRMLREKCTSAICEALNYSEKNELLLVHTGDVMTFCNDENLRFLDEHFSDRDYILAIGNHDFCGEGENGDDIGNVAKNSELLKPHFKTDLIFESRIFNGEVNVISMQDGFFRISENCLNLLKEEVSKGLPIILCMHVPIFTDAQARERMKISPCAHLLGPSDEILSLYPEHCKNQKADKSTEDAIAYIKSAQLIKAIIAGHTHMNYEEMLTPSLHQIVTANLMSGYARQITVI